MEYLFGITFFLRVNSIALVMSDTFNRFMEDLVSKRALFDFLVVCDESNNTPARIDRNELYIDIAIQPVKAIEFIYIPLRIKNTGESLTS